MKLMKGIEEDVSINELSETYSFGKGINKQDLIFLLSNVKKLKVLF